MLAVWQPLQVDHKDGPYSDMQKAEKSMAEWKGIPVLEFEFKEAEVCEMNTDGKFKKMDGSLYSPYDDDGNLVSPLERDETDFKQRLGDFLLVHGIADAMCEDSDEEGD